LATAREIIYLWVARMVMAGAEFLDHLPKEKRIPFEVCYINATVLDAQGRRMSKSLGNGIDPLEMIDRYGADAVRYSLVMLTREGQDVKLAEDRFELGQRFCNKIWNATRFVLGSVGEGPVPASFPDSAPLEDRWIRSRAAETIARVTEALEEYRFHDAAQEMYRFTWNDFCDWYLEAVKPRLATPTAPHRDAAIFTLLETLGITLRLLHPFLPFLTEELWQNLPQTQGLLINAPWPKADERARDREAEATFERVREVVSASRNIRSQMNVPPGLQLPLLVKTESAGSAESLERIRPLLLSLARANSLEAGPGVAKPPASASAILSGGTLFIPLGGVIDLNVERTRLGKESERLANLIEGTERKLSNESFVSRAKPEVVAAEREKLDSLRADMAKVQTAIQDLAE
jgi:valyl-tRNA synthetase